MMQTFTKNALLSSSRLITAQVRLLKLTPFSSTSSKALHPSIHRTSLQINSPPLFPLSHRRHQSTSSQSSESHSNDEKHDQKSKETREQPQNRSYPKIAIGTLIALLAAKNVITEDGRRDTLIFFEAISRFIRSAYNCGIIVVDYKLSLGPYQRKNDDTSEDYKRTKSEVHKRSAQRLLDLFLSLGGIYIKAGQHIASLNHILPKEWTDAFIPCQNEAPFRPLNEIQAAFSRNFHGKTIEDVFSEFSALPIAAASLAQVHDARLKSTCERVAVKVQYPGLRDRCDGDVHTITFLLHAVERVFPELKLEWLIEEFNANLPEELNFVKEARNNEKISSQFSAWSNVKTPKIHWDYTSQDIICMEFVDGVKINDLNGLKRIGASPELASRLLAEVFSAQIFLPNFGFVHCDPHPGNVLVRKGNKKKTGFELVLLDHGLYRELPPSFQATYARLWKALILRELPQIETCAVQLGLSSDQAKLLATMLTNRSWEKAQIGLGHEFDEQEAEELRVYGAENVAEITQVLDKVPKPMLLLFKCNDLLRSVQRDLGVPMNYFATMARFAMKGLHEHVGKRRSIFELFRQWYESASIHLRLMFVDWMAKRDAMQKKKLLTIVV